MFDGIVNVIKGLIQREAARLVAYSSAVATSAALFIAGQLGVELSVEFIAAVGLAAAALTTEAIRLLVYSKKTTQAIADNAAATGSTDIGNPPEGPVDAQETS